MEQPISTPYGSNKYPNMVEMPASLPPCTMSNGPLTPGSRQQSLDEAAYFSTMPQELFNFAVTTVSESSLDPWLMDMPGTASPDSSRMSMSPSQGISTPSSDGFYSSPYPEHLHFPAYRLLEQPQPLRSRSTSHPNWVNNGENWERNYAESELWATHPFGPQPWVPSPYEGYPSSNMTTGYGHTSNGALPTYTYVAQDYIPAPEVAQTTAATGNRRSPTGSEDDEDEDSSDEESDWDEKASNYSHSESSASRSRPKTRLSRPHIDRWSIPVPSIQQSEVRGHMCNIPGCTTAFVRPEHLRRHVRSKHLAERAFQCKVPECKTAKFSRGDNLRDHYWTHLDRGGRVGKNQKFTLQKLKEIIGPKDKKLIRRLREKQRQHQDKEKVKKQRVARMAYPEPSML